MRDYGLFNSYISPLQVKPPKPVTDDDNPPRHNNLSDASMLDLKVRVNELIWEYAPGECTLGDMETLSIQIVDSIINGEFRHFTSPIEDIFE